MQESVRRFPVDRGSHIAGGATMRTKLQINLSIKWLQQMRFVHALTESEFEIAVPAAEQAKFALLREKFGVHFCKDRSHALDITNHLIISREPKCSLGDVSRPLIYPQAIASYCRSLWAETREHRYSFQGLVTGKRKRLIETWIERNVTGERFRLQNQQSILCTLWRTVLAGTGLDSTRKQKVGALLLWSSDRGRRFPIKAWDEEYFRLLANSQFVLCPSGDCVWSYRFFEAILCGALPIVEKTCPAYDGFRFFAFDDRADALNWSREDVEYNHRLGIERLTVPTKTLNDELAKIVAANGRPG